ncbi:MAG: hypothetical protein VYE40_15840 [Myxococcota bacterium]|nr:hypothetical protein [Myxococcota bacterium]MEC9442565.1 hypothetical protein [Myxococcota bacterium]
MAASNTMINWHTDNTTRAQSEQPEGAFWGHSWGGFTQLALRASASMAIAALRASVEDWLSHEGGPGTHHLCFCEHGEWVLIGEPHVDLDARIIHAASAEMIAQYAMLDAVFFGHDPLTGTMRLSIFKEGEPELTWEDSLEPFAENAAITFHGDGRCTHEDARRYALRALDLPSDTPWLDRIAFMEFTLHHQGIHIIDPELEEQPLTHMLHAIDLNE